MSHIRHNLKPLEVTGAVVQSSPEVLLQPAKSVGRPLNSLEGKTGNSLQCFQGLSEARGGHMQPPQAYEKPSEILEGHSQLSVRNTHSPSFRTAPNMIGTGLQSRSELGEAHST